MFLFGMTHYVRHGRGCLAPRGPRGLNTGSGALPGQVHAYRGMGPPSNGENAVLLEWLFWRFALVEKLEASFVTLSCLPALLDAIPLSKDNAGWR